MPLKRCDTSHSPYPSFFLKIVGKEMNYSPGTKTILAGSGFNLREIPGFPGCCSGNAGIFNRYAGELKLCQPRFKPKPCVPQGCHVMVNPREFLPGGHFQERLHVHPGITFGQQSVVMPNCVAYGPFISGLPDAAGHQHQEKQRGEKKLRHSSAPFLFGEHEAVMHRIEHIRHDEKRNR